ncbi:MAG: C39 family peptidase [Clostridia bacterium]|nr:C39 family peptidase [Clostridia bacterium]
MTENIETLEKEFSKCHNKKKLIILLISIAALLSIVAVLCISIVTFCSVDTYVEIDDRPDYRFITDSNMLNSICKIETDLNSVDTSKISTVAIDLRFFGFLNKTTQMHIVDTTPPKINVQKVVATVGSEISPKKFISDIVDKTNVTIKITPDTSDLPAGKHTVKLIAIDEGQNKTETTTELTVVSPTVPLFFEYGMSVDDIENILLSEFGENIDFNMPEQGSCSKLTIEGYDEDSVYFVDIEIRDTIAPTAVVKSFDILLGEKLTEDDILTDIFDHSEVTVNMCDFPDFTKIGEHIVSIVITDEYNNSSKYLSYIRIHNINTEIDVEINSHNDDIIDKIFNDNFSKNKLSFIKENFFNFLGIKETTITLKGEFNNIKIKVNVVDSTPPVLKIKYVEKVITSKVSPEEFVYICKDATKVNYSFIEEPKTNATGTFRVTIAATDEGGNTTTATANLIVHADTTPPEIHGAKDFTTFVGSKPNYLNGVYATDKISKYVDLNVDSSQVNINKAGVYPVTYNAIDQYKNEAETTVYITVKESIRVCLDIENILQNPSLPNGCEVVSLAIALKYNNFPVDPVWLFKNYMPSSSIMSNGDPWETYIGDPAKVGFGCYAPCVVKTGNDFLSDMNSELKVKDVSGQDLTIYEEYINNGTPVIMWATTYMVDNDTLCRSWKSDEKSVVWHYYSHCLVMIGYTEDKYIFCDPLRGIVEYSKSSVERAFDINFKQACIIE